MLKANFDKMGINAEQTEMFGSAYASAVYLSKVLKLPEDKKVYVIGQEGLEEELDELGIAHIGGSVCYLYFIVLRYGSRLSDEQ